MHLIHLQGRQLKLRELRKEINIIENENQRFLKAWPELLVLFQVLKFLHNYIISKSLFSSF